MFRRWRRAVKVNKTDNRPATINSVTLTVTL